MSFTERAKALQTLRVALGDEIYKEQKQLLIEQIIAAPGESSTPPCF